MLTTGLKIAHADNTKLSVKIRCSLIIGKLLVQKIRESYKGVDNTIDQILVVSVAPLKVQGMGSNPSVHLVDGFAFKVFADFALSTHDRGGKIST